MFNNPVKASLLNVAGFEGNNAHKVATLVNQCLKENPDKAVQGIIYQYGIKASAFIIFRVG